MTILCGTDLSEAGAVAARSAAALARLRGEDLCLVHVIDEELERVIPAGVPRLVAAASRRLGAQAARLRSGRRRVQTLVRVGRPAEVLREGAGLNPSLVVVASSGHAEAPLFRVGGTSERLAVSPAVPLLVVRRAEPLEAWARGEPLTVLLGIDFTESADAALAFVKELRQLARCHVVVAHVYDPDEAQRRYGGAPRTGFTQRDAAIERLVARDVAARVGHFGGPSGKRDVRIRVVPGLGRLADHLLDLADAEGADLVVVGTSTHHGLGRLLSVSAGVLHLGRCSVAVIPPKAAAAAGETVPALRRVLVAADLSPSGAELARYAIALVGGRGEVHLLHVSSRRNSREATAAAERSLRALLPRARQRGVAVHTHVASGPVARTICQVAEQVGVDAICISSRRAAGVAPLLLGSVAQAVLRESERPVFVVRPRREA
jgi:nucleotide-binding universal stress UspA family protein